MKNLHNPLFFYNKSLRISNKLRYTSHYADCIMFRFVSLAITCLLFMLYFLFNFTLPLPFAIIIIHISLYTNLILFRDEIFLMIIFYYLIVISTCVGIDIINFLVYFCVMDTNVWMDPELINMLSERFFDDLLSMNNNRNGNGNVNSSYWGGQGTNNNNPRPPNNNNGSWWPFAGGETTNAHNRTGTVPDSTQPASGTADQGTRGEHYAHAIERGYTDEQIRARLASLDPSIRRNLDFAHNSVNNVNKELNISDAIRNIDEYLQLTKAGFESNHLSGLRDRRLSRVQGWFDTIRSLS